MNASERLATIAVQAHGSQAPDTGTAYGRKTGTHDAFLTEVRPGTPCGEFMRRYWHPFALSSDATTTPMEVRLLGEDLILFRDKQGRPGLLHPRCVHRGTSLLYGKCEDDGIRCCYHGWKFDVQGNCLEQPCEPQGGLKRDAARQPWYPVQDQYGLVWAYMGPPEKKPLLPKYDILENLGPDEYIEADDLGRASGGFGKRFITPCNWLQQFENTVDPAHVQILHIRFSGIQFTPDIPDRIEPWTFEYTDVGVKQMVVGHYKDGRRVERTFETRWPGERRTSDPGLAPGPMTLMGFTTAIDDTHHMVFAARKLKRSHDPDKITTLKMAGKRWDQMTPTERRDMPSDYEAQVGQGSITLHSEEHLGTTDKGIVMLRRLLRKEIEKVLAGGDPAGVIFDVAQQVIKVEGGNFFTWPDKAASPLGEN